MAIKNEKKNKDLALKMQQIDVPVVELVKKLDESVKKNKKSKSIKSSLTVFSNVTSFSKKFDKLESLNFGRVLSIKDGIVIANVWKLFVLENLFVLIIIKI